MKYRKKPLVIEAMQYTGTNIDELIEWSQDNIDWNYWQKAWIVDTLEGAMKIDLYDYVIKGIEGELYPCKPGIFTASYEPELA